MIGQLTRALQLLQLLIIASLFNFALAAHSVDGCGAHFSTLTCDPPGKLNKLTNPRITWYISAVSGAARDNLKTVPQSAIDACKGQHMDTDPAGETWQYFEMQAADTTNVYHIFVKGMVGSTSYTSQDISLCANSAPSVLNDKLKNCKCTTN